MEYGCVVKQRHRHLIDSDKCVVCNVVGVSIVVDPCPSRKSKQCDGD